MLNDAGPQVIVAAAHAVDHRSPVTQRHSSRVAGIADATGRHAGFSSGQQEDLRSAAFLHDVGHMTLSAGGQEFEMAGHAEEGARIVAGANFPEVVVAGVRHHHARWDGRDQTDGVSGESIPIIARTLAAAEKYEALTAGRACSKVPPREAMRTLRPGRALSSTQP